MKLEPERDYYEVLGVRRSANHRAIREAYRQLVKQYHPDVNPGDRISEERFREIQKAYETLTNSKARAAYEDSLMARATREQIRRDETEAAEISRRARPHNTEPEPQASEQKPIRGHKTALLVFCAVAAVAVTCIAVSELGSNDESTIATVVSCGPIRKVSSGGSGRSECDIQYTYQVAGKSYTGHGTTSICLGFGHTLWCPNRTAAISYSKADPGKSWTTGPDRLSTIATAVLAMCLMVFGVVVGGKIKKDRT